MAYPVRPDPAELDDLFIKKKKEWLKNVETVMTERQAAPDPRYLNFKIAKDGDV